MKSILARAFLFAVGCILALSWSLNCIADEKVDLLIASLRARGSSLNGYSWSYQTSKLSGKPAYENGKGPSEDLVIAHRQKVSDLLRDPKFSAEGVACLDARTGRYKIEHAGNGQWLGERKVALNTYQVFSFDGDVYGSLQQAAPAASNPSEKGGLQQPVVVEFDSTTADNDSVNALMESCGINYLPTNLFTFGYEFGNLEIASPLLRLADLLETRSGIATFTASGPTDWNVTVALPGAEGRAIRYHFNPEENYSATRISLASILKDSVTTDDVFIYNKLYKARIWAPHRIERYNWINGIGSDIKLKNFDISAVFSDEMFSLSVPTGAQVHDHITGMSYIVSSGPVNEARAIAEYVGKHRLSVDNTHETSRWQLRTIGIAGAAVVFVSLVVARWRRKASGKAQTLVFCFCSLSIAGCGSKTDMTHGDPQRGVASVSASSVSWGDGWETSIAGRKSVKIVQCGFTATAVLLEMFGINFDPLFVMKELVPTMDGVRLSNMLLVLESHGLTVEARKNVSLDSLIKSLEAGTAVILAVPAEGYPVGHYVVLSRNELGNVVFIDAPNPPKSPNQFMALQEKDKKYTVLLCRMIDNNASYLPEDTIITFSPEDFTDGKLEGTLRFTNKGRRAVAFVNVALPCSCVSVNFERKVVNAGESVNYKYCVTKENWGNGLQNKEVRLLTADNKSVLFKFSGRADGAGTKPERRRTLRRSVLVPLNCGVSPILQELVIPLSFSDVKAPVFVKSVGLPSWISVSTIEKDAGIHLHLECSISPESVQSMSKTRGFKRSFTVYLESLSKLKLEIELTFARDIPVANPLLQVRSRKGEATLDFDRLSPQPPDLSDWTASSAFVSSSKVSVGAVRQTGPYAWAIHFDASNALGDTFDGHVVFTNPRHPVAHVPFNLLFLK